LSIFIHACVLWEFAAIGLQECMGFRCFWWVWNSIVFWCLL